MIDAGIPILRCLVTSFRQKVLDKIFKPIHRDTSTADAEGGLTLKRFARFGTQYVSNKLYVNMIRAAEAWLHFG